MLADELIDAGQSLPDRTVSAAGKVSRGCHKSDFGVLR
jgi:hypothetical protein